MSRVEESSSKTRVDSQIQRLAESAQTSANEFMTVELKEDLCKDEATEFVWYTKQSRCVRFLERVTHDEFVICV
jgi:hypothetical protein